MMLKKALIIENKHIKAPKISITYIILNFKLPVTHTFTKTINFPSNY